MLKMNLRKIINRFIMRLWHTSLFGIFRPQLIELKRHDNYENYLKKQKEKTLDKERIEKWLGEEWEIKLNGFRELFKRNNEYVEKSNKFICLGARTGQEVAALHEIGKNAIGIDLVGFPPLTIEGDIHNLKYGDCSFDFIFTNIFDHSLYPNIFVSEMERICDNSGYILINLQVHNRGDDYSENIINDLNGIIKLFKESELILSRRITNTFDGMDWEIIMQKS